MNKRRFSMGMLALIACCLFLVPARTVFADETMTHIEGTVSFDDDNNLRGAETREPYRPRWSWPQGERHPDGR